MENIDVMIPRDFIFGGNANFTLLNENSNISYQYVIKRCKDNNKMFFVSVKEGREPLTYAGYMVVINENTIAYQTGKKGNRSRTDPAIKGLEYAIVHGKATLPSPMRMYHHGKCACCGKKLTDEESIRLGIGPYCRKVIRHEH